MITATTSLAIGRPPDEVFDLVSDPVRDLEWDPMVTTIMSVSGTPGLAGARYTGTYRPFGECQLEILDVERPSRATLSGTSKHGSFRYTYAIAPSEAGSVLSLETLFAPRGVGKLAAPLLRIMLTRRVRALRMAVKRRLEQPTSVPPSQYA
jgi:hypothetical protein